MTFPPHSVTILGNGGQLPESHVPYSSRAMPDDLTIALEHHQAGRLAEATRIYQQLLTVNPNHADALHLLGVAAYQKGQAAEAVTLISRAIVVNARVAAYHSNLGEAYRAQGQYDKAAACFRTALRLQPPYAEACSNLGLTLMAQGQLDEAIEQFRLAIQISPRFGMAHNNLGNALRLKGDVQQAVVHFRQAIAVEPTLAEAHSNLGQMLTEQDQLQEALELCREAVRLRPDLAEAHNNLGNVLRALDQLDEAKQCYQQALALNPHLAMSYNNMGQALQQEGKFDEAKAWYQQALEREPTSARFYTNLASAFEAEERYAEARTHYETALQCDPEYAEAHGGLASVLHAEGDYAGAERHFREAVRLKPWAAGLHAGLGTVLEELGQFDAALACWREALRHAPEHAGALCAMATMLKAKLPKEDRGRMEHLVADPKRTEGYRSVMHYGLAQIYDAEGQFDQAALHLREANALRKAGQERQGKAYRPEEHERFVERLIALTGADFFAKARGGGLESQRPIFIVGMPRSGTTLTEQILASHSQVFGAGELRLARRAFESLPQLVNRRDPPVECLAYLDRTAVRRLAQHYLDGVSNLDAQAPRVADKMPDNYLYLGLLAVIFPRARFIHTRRDLRDVAVSCWMTNFKEIRWACDPDHIAHRVRLYRRLMEHWQQALPVSVLHIDYEDTVADLEGVARRLVQWCGLEWEPECLAFHETRRPVRTASVTQVRQPIYTRSVQRWRHYEKDLGSLFNQLGSANLASKR